MLKIIKNPRKNLENVNEIEIIENQCSGNIPKLYISGFIGCLNFMGAVLVPFFLDWGNITFAQTMILQSWFAGWILILEIPTGTIADYLGRKISLVLSDLAGIIAILIYTSIPDFNIFLLGEFFFSLAVALMSGASDALVYDTLKTMNKEDEAKHVFSRIGSLCMVGMAVGSPIGSLIAAIFGVRECFLFMVFPIFIALIIDLTLKEPELHTGEKKQNPAKILKKGIQVIRENRYLRLLSVDMLVISVISYFIIWCYQPRLQEIGIGIEYFGLVHTGMVLAQVMVMNFHIPVEKIFHSKKIVIIFTAIITGIGFILSGITSMVLLVILGIILAGGFGLSRRTITITYINKYIPSEQRATTLSAIGMCRQLILMMLNPIIGMLVEYSLPVVLIILGTLAILWGFIVPIKEEYLID